MAIPSKNADLIRRLKFYGFGFCIGLLAVSMIYKGRGCQMPGSAKLSELGWQKLEFCDDSCKIKRSEIIEVLGTGQTVGKGKVNYDFSDVHNKPFPVYAIEGLTAAGKNLRIMITDRDTISKVIKVIDLSSKDSCICK
ncbi:MAG: hypothetical protein ACJ77K_01360 [Bacteroidia bacterium]